LPQIDAPERNKPFLFTRLAKTVEDFADAVFQLSGRFTGDAWRTKLDAKTP
jgi:hypothetical protein